MKQVSSHKQLFIDDAFFASIRNVTLTMNLPRKTDERTIIADQPWESAVGGCDTVIQMGDEWWLYYDTHLFAPADKPILFYGRPWKEPLRFMCLATSKDGIHWKKPSLGLVEFNGSKDNNIVHPPNIFCWGGPNHVFIDTKPGIPADEKYKATFHWDGPKGDQSGGCWILKSPDGLHWSPLMDKPVYYNSDTDNTLFWDERIGKYVFYFRDNSEHYTKDPIYQKVKYANRNEVLTNKAGRIAPYEPGIRYRDYAFRKIRRFEVDNLRTMPDLLAKGIVYNHSQIVAEADPEETPGVDYDSNFFQKYPWADNVYLMFPGMLRHLYYPPFSRNDPYPATEPCLDAICEVRLMTSRDGVNFRFPSRQPFVPLGVAGSYDSGFVEFCTGMVPDGPNLYLYYNCRHDTIRHGAVPQEYWRKNPPFISRLVMRRDGFVSVDADNQGGEFTTVPMTFDGTALQLNVECTVAGYLIVELLRDGKPIQGFSFKDCDAVEGNHIDKTVTWNSNSNLSALLGQPLQMRFVMRNTKLYAFQFGKLQS